MNEDEDADRAATRSKLALLIEKYELDGFGDELEDRWTEDGDERMSLRELATFVNEELVTAALDESAGQTVDGTAANYYRLLTDDDVSSGTRIEVENELESLGVDVDQLQSDFVSRQAVHTYLTNERGADYEPAAQSDSDRAAERLRTIQRLKNRLVAVGEQTVSALTRSGYLSVGDPRVTVLVNVQCRDCGTQYSIADLIEDGGCDCDQT